MVKKAKSRRFPLEKPLDSEDIVPEQRISSPITGHIEILTSRIAVGWAFDASAPEKRLLIEAESGGKIVGRTTANLLRADVAAQHGTDGYCGFSLEFDEAIDGDHLPAVRVADTANGATVLKSKSTGLEGRVEVITRSIVGGWVWIPTDPSAEVRVELLSDGEIIGSAVANSFRGDVEASGRGAGYCGFRIAYDGAALLAPPEVRAWGAAGPEILGGVSELAPDEPMPPPVANATPDSAVAALVQGHVDSMDFEKASGWAWLPENPYEALEVEAVLNDVVIGRAIADRMRSDLAEANKGDGKYGFLLKFDQRLAGDQVPLLQVVRPDGAVALRGKYKLSVLKNDPAPLDPREPETLAGEVESVNRTQASGWGWVANPDNLDTFAEAVLHGKIIGRALLDRPLDGSAVSEQGATKYGFVMEFFRPIEGDVAPVLRILRPDGRYSLKVNDQLSPALQNGFASRGEEDQPKAPTYVGNFPYEGNLDRLTASEASGWAWLPGRPEVEVEIEAALDGEPLGRCVANWMRPDLWAGGKGTGLYGFHLWFDRPLNQEAVPLIEIAGPAGRMTLPGNYQMQAEPEPPAEADAAAAAAEATLPAFEGNIDFISRDEVNGWAWVPGKSELRVDIEATIDGKLVGSTCTSILREDLVLGGKGDGRHGFVLRFDPPLDRGTVPVLEIVTPDGRFSLPGDRLFDPASEAGEFETPPSEPLTWLPEGNLDRLTTLSASGWAWLPNRPESSVEIEAVLDGRLLGSTRANKLRRDLLAAGKGTGRYGFLLSFSPPLDGSVSPVIEAVYPEGRLALPGKYEFQQEERGSAGASDLAGNVDFITFVHASGWAWLPDEADAAVEIEAVLDGTVIGRTIADQMRPDLAKAGVGTGRYGFTLPFDEKLTGDKMPVIRGIRNGRPIELQGNYEFNRSGSADGAAQAKSQFATAQGYVERLTRQGAYGWAWNPGNQQEAVRVEAVLDGRVIGRATAAEPRDDLAQSGLGSGRYGFSLNFDEMLTGPDAPVVRALVAGSEALPGAGVLPPLPCGKRSARERGTIETLLRQQAEFTSRGREYEEFDPAIILGASQNSKESPPGDKPLLIAFYLPRFETAADASTGQKGRFSNWRDLPRAASRFPGHYQPRIPGELGYYDPAQLETFRRQVKLAKAAAIGAFAFYYRLDRKHPIEQPLGILLESETQMNFLLILSDRDHNKCWNGFGSESSSSVDDSWDNESSLLADIAKHVADPRYVRINSRPLIIIQSFEIVPGGAATIARWRHRMLLEFGIEPLIFLGQTFGETDPERFCGDGAIEFPPHKFYEKSPFRATPDAYARDFSGKVIDYTQFMACSLNEPAPKFPLIKTIVPGWDNECQHPGHGITIENSSPRTYQIWLEALIRQAMERPIYGTPIVAINAWNEWAESAYLEPDLYYGYNYLNRTAQAYVNILAERKRISNIATNDRQSVPKVSVIFPNYNHEKFIVERIQSVLNQSQPADEIIFLDDCSVDNSVQLARQTLEAGNVPYRIVVNEKNSGGVFKQWLKGIALAKNSLIWVAETDDTVHRDFLAQLLPRFTDEEVMAAYGRISYIEPDGSPNSYLDGYYAGLENFSWLFPAKIPAYQAFSFDFSVTNVIPNASGLVFRKPILTSLEIDRLIQYRFAGDWYFYALAIRGGAVAYEPAAKSYFRLNRNSTSQSSFHSERHLREHRMILEDLVDQYGICSEAIGAHAERLHESFPDLTIAELLKSVTPDMKRAKDSGPLRICIACLGFSVGGGEVVPLVLANELRGRGHHITYLALERLPESDATNIQARLRSDIPVIYWEDIKDNFGRFVTEHGIEVINSHNVGIEFQIYWHNLELNVPFVVSLHGSHEAAVEIMNERFGAWLARNVTSWLYLSEKNKPPLLKIGAPEDKFERSFNALPRFDGEKIDRVQFRAQHGIPENATVAFICSRAIPDKGWQLALDVVNRAGKNIGQTIYLVLIGSGPCHDELAAKYSKSKHIIFMGYVENPARYFGCFDLALFPTTFVGESFPLFLIECFQSGLPVIATDIAEIPFIMGMIPSDQPGAMVDYRLPPKKIVLAMTKILERFLADESLFQRMRENAEKAGGRFSIDLLSETYEQRFRRLIAAPKPCAAEIGVSLASASGSKGFIYPSAGA